MSNTWGIDQTSTVLKELFSYSLGKQTAGMDTSSLLTLAQRTVAAGAADPLIGKLTQMYARTIISQRKYNAGFLALQKSAAEYGNAVRKITPLDNPKNIVDNPEYNLPDGTTVDQYAITADKAVEYTFLGQQTYQIPKTVYTDQLRVAFTNATEMQLYMSAQMTEYQNKIGKLAMEESRALVAGAIGGVLAGSKESAIAPERVVHLLAEYNTATGQELTKADIYKPGNFKPFMAWAYSRINTIKDMLSEYSTRYHTNSADGDILRHTPSEYLNFYLLGSYKHQSTMMQLADTYHDTFMTLPGYDTVNFWQSPEAIEKIVLKKPQYIDANGKIKTFAQTAGTLTQDNVFGVLFDVEAMGINPIINKVRTTPLNAKGDYYNIFTTVNIRHWIDYTENMVVFLLD